MSALALVLGTVAVAFWAWRRWGGGAVGRTPRGRPIRITARVPVAPKQGVAVLEVEGRTLLVGYGEGGVRFLTHLGEVEESGDETVPGSRPAGSGDAVVPLFDTVLAGARRALARGALPLVLGVCLVASPVRAGAQTTPTPTGEPDAQVEEAATDAVATLLKAAPRMSLSLRGEDGEGLQISGPVGTILFMGFMTLLPTLLLLTTGFARILIVLHLLKQALGTQTAPPAHLLTALALLLTGYVMAPTFDRVHDEAVAPWVAGEIDELQMMRAAEVPMRRFMLASTREQDLAAFLEMRDAPPPETVDDVPFVVLTSAFVTSELTRAFQMGFALFLPFVVIDVVVASVLMSMGMFMLPPVMVSLPFKLLLFVLVDGWSLVMGSLVRSF